ncbi:hypothetical protein WMY93_021859 [Mugilogobius chulae]|uniref:Uncharacterized protein n=1 Tax=Mugilogobius chulae TaxID=88201 RepID=A0AAW0NGH0_9GOBI
MGKKSLNSFSTLHHNDFDSGHLRDLRTEETTRLQRNARLKSHPVKPEQTHSLAPVHNRWRREDRYKYLREITDLLRLALKLQEDLSI